MSSRHTEGHRREKHRHRSHSRSPHRHTSRSSHRTRHDVTNDSKQSHSHRRREDHNSGERHRHGDPPSRLPIKTERHADHRRMEAINGGSDRRERQQNDERRRQRREQSPFDGRSEDPAADNDDQEPAPEKQKANMELSGKLTEDTNTYRGVVIKYSEPPEARKPKRRWRFYPFKGDEALPVLHLHRQSAYLLGRDRKVADIPVDHPSCSKQHAVLQFRLVDYTRSDGTMGRHVRPYVIDLGSANGTFVNNNPIEAQRYVELMEKDVVKFGFSSREYVLLHEQSEIDDDEGVD